MEMLHELTNWIVQTVGQWGYFGIIAMMFLESSLFPFPSEIVIIPAGYLAFQGDMSMAFVVISGLLGSLSGAIFNYWLAATWGRNFLERYGRYFLILLRRAIRQTAYFVMWPICCSYCLIC